MDLPPILTFNNGKPVDDTEKWPTRRRELLHAFADQYYGIMPEMPVLDILDDDGGQPCEINGVAVIRRQLRVGIEHPDIRHRGLQVLLWLPADAAEKPAPCFIGLNFHGNHGTSHDPDVNLPWSNCPDQPPGYCAWTWPADKRGNNASRWPVDVICGRGYAVATVHCADIAPDHALNFSKGLAGKIAPGRDASWRCVGRWAWGLSALRIALSELPEINGDKMACIGHSRLGKASLWAGAQDSAFKLVISNNSGCCGAALNRRSQGETLKPIVSHFPHWFVPAVSQWFERDAELPYDAHQLIACVAPRCCHVGSATEDTWADPEGEFLALQAAGEAWRFLGKKPIGKDTAWPSAGEAVQSDTAYHLRDGRHGIDTSDWQHYLNSADQVFAES